MNFHDELEQLVLVQLTKVAPKQPPFMADASASETATPTWCDDARAAPARMPPHKTAATTLTILFIRMFVFVTSFASSGSRVGSFWEFLRA
ncbi:MAG: hypothetical protein AAB676_15525, partial [Verrucomicrobiota bacterium]